MFTLSQAFIYQIEFTFYGVIIIMLSILISGEKDRWYKFIDEHSPFRNPYFLTIMLWFWFIGMSYFRYYYQIGPWGLMDVPYASVMSPMIAWIVRIVGVTILITGITYLKKRNNIAS